MVKKLWNTRSINFLFILLCYSCQQNNNLIFLESLEVLNNNQNDSILIPRNSYSTNNSTVGESKKLERSIIFDERFNMIHGNPIEHFRSNKFQLNKHVYSLLVHPEWNSLILNFDLKGNYLNSFDVGACGGDSYILNNEIICNQAYGYPYYSFKRFKVDSLGQFTETQNYIPTQSKRLEKEHFNFIVSNLAFLDTSKQINCFDEEFFRDEYPNYIELTNIELEKLFLNKTGIDIENPKYFSFLGKIKTNIGFVIAIDFYYDIPNIDFSKKIMFLSYNSSNKLVDIIFPNDFVVDASIQEKTITLKTNSHYTDSYNKQKKWLITNKGRFQKL